MDILGAEVHGVQLNSNLGRDTAEQLRAALDLHGLLVFRDQQLQPEHHLAIAGMLGDVFPLPARFQHEKSPARDILRMSNDISEGFTGVGTTGWHIDGASYETPFTCALMHIVHVPKCSAPTLFLPLRPLADYILERRPEWARLSARVGKGENGLGWHPLLFAHPRTGHPSVILGKLSAFAWSRGAAREEAATAEETAATLDELNGHVERFSAGATYRHEWSASGVLETSSSSTTSPSLTWPHRRRSSRGRRRGCACCIASSSLACSRSGPLLERQVDSYLYVAGRLRYCDVKRGVLE